MSKLENPLLALFLPTNPSMFDRKTWLIATILVIGIIHRVWDRYFDTSLRVTFFDVGQGDAALIQFGGGKTMLVDSGGGYRDYNEGDRTIVPELSRLGILSPDYAVLSHPDQDHGYGFLGIFRCVKTKAWWVNAYLWRTPKPLLLRLSNQAEKAKTAQTLFRSDTKLDLGNANVRLITLGAHEKKSNNQSLVLFLDFAGCRVLFTGDIEKQGEEDLRLRHLPALTLLKVSHHGSKTSTTEGFLQWAKPRFSVVSVGKRNRYGHPHPRVIDRLQQTSSQVFRTDFHGYLKFTITRNGEIFCESSHGDCGHSKCIEHAT